MVQLKKDSAWSGDIKVVSNVWTVQQNGATNQAVRDPNYASVKQPKPYTSTYKQPTSLKEDISNVVDKVVKPYSAEDIKLSPMPKPWPEIRPEDTFEETAWGWNYDYDRAVSQERNQQWTLNALQGTGHVAGLSEREVPSVQTYSPAPRGRNLANIWLSLGEWQLEGIDMSSYDTPTATATSWANMWASSGGFNWTVAQPQGRQLKNADVNFSQYWDDSSAPNQATAGGQNDKYTWEFTRNSNIWYDPNITTADLDPNYLFWMDAQWANSDQAGYIARRNDMIASALYNEWKTSKDDVINFLSSQPWWMNSTEADRYNTIESIWKRLGGIEQQNQINDAAQAQADNLPATYSDASLNNMENDLRQSTAWELYGKVTADQDTHIKTLEDDNSVYKAMNESRIQSYKQLRWMDSQSIAAAIVSWVMAMDSQQMRDLMQYDPAKYQEVKQAEKQIRGQMNINSITSGEWEWNSSVTNWSSSLQNEKTSFATSNANWVTNTADILKSVNSTLNSNDVASTASEQMASIENDMSNLQNRLKNLKKEASTVFKWDVPQYIVNAYVANRTAEIQDQLSILENRYNAAYSRYQNEWEQTKWKAEFDLKKQELELKKQSANLDEWNTRQGIALKWADLNGTTNGTTPISTLQAQEALNVLSDFSSAYPTNSHWWQCWAFVKKYLASIGVNLPNVSSIDSKKSLIDDSITDPSDWDIVIMSSKNYPQNWHMAIVESVDDDGTIHLLESNWNWDEQVHRRTVKPWDKSILGYYRPTGWTANTSSSWYEWKNVTNWIFTRNDWLQFDLSTSPLYASLNDTDKKTVIWLLNLQTDPNSLTTRMWYDKGQAQKLINAAQDINPAWKQDDFSNWQKVRQWWEKGKQWGWISRNWTAMKAAKELYEMVDEIDKFPSMTLNWLKNAASAEFWDPKIVKFKTTLEWFVTEAAGALKWWNAANATQDVARMDEILNQKMTKAQLKTSIRQLVDLLYGKNESEAMSVWDATYIKPDTPRIDEVADWMYNDLWIRGQEIYYNYTPKWWWAAAAKSNSWGGTSSTYSPQMTQNLFNY